MTCAASACGESEAARTCLILPRGLLLIEPSKVGVEVVLLGVELQRDAHEGAGVHLADGPQRVVERQEEPRGKPHTESAADRASHALARPKKPYYQVLGSDNRGKRRSV